MIEYTSVKGKVNPVSPEYTASTIEFISIPQKTNEMIYRMTFYRSFGEN
jgi:hypothetical protein